MSGGGGGAAPLPPLPAAVARGMPTVRQFVEDVTTGSVTCEEHMWRISERIRLHEGEVHAYIEVGGGAMEAARGIDARVRAGQKVGRLAGLPMAVKDNICVSSMRTTCASRMLEEFVPPHDATAAARLLAEDAIIAGKSNMDEFAMGMTTEYSAFGPTRNPWDARRVPGGSSGGSAAAVSAGECIAALGSDTGGSVRNPASFCGIVGHKPTYGLVSRHGLVSYANSIEQIGPMARTVEDAAIILGIIAGRDRNDDTTIGAAEPGHADYAAGLGGGVDGLRVGVVKEMVDGGVTEPAVAAAVRRAASAAERAGAQCEDVSLGMAEYAVAAYYTITSAEAGSNLARYDNIRYGYGAGADDPSGYEFNAYVTRSRSRLGPEVKRRLMLGGFVASAGHAGRYYLKALRVRERITQQIASLLGGVDVLIAPTVPVLPFRLGEKLDDPVTMFMADYTTVAANLSGRPAASVPFGTARLEGSELPVGVQVIGDAMGDALVLRVAHALEKAAGGAGRP